MVDYEMHTLPNGIRVLHKQVGNTKIAHCGFMLDIGSRDETEENQGIAHFWEHMAFKGTRKRKAFHILNRIDSVGGEINAYTTKEKIAFYASVLDNYFEKAVEILSDITFDSVFPEKQIEKERNVILEEMAMYYDSPEDAIQDDFDNLVFQGHPLGMNILGTADSVRSFHRDDFTRFIKANINTERLVFCSVANLPFKKVVKLAEKYLKDLPAFAAGRERTPFTGYKPAIKKVTRNLTQAQCAIGRGDAYADSSVKRLPFFMLVNILGGPGMNSRLNLALREKHGFVYSIDASYQAYTDTGLFGIFFGTEPKQLNRSVRLVKKELQKLKEKPLGIKQLHTAKEQLMGQLAMAEENNISLMLMMGKSILDRNKIESLDEIFNKIKNTTAKELQDLANEMFDENQMSQLIFLPD
ncbi:pitrilysin family protein [Fulvivirga kasyanovii]|uniref:Insulinase family protein n=1 Tax=Fulvivirga kasyanovii TaxID=396812 RepID=A0ABW9RV62_9BACT|nr:pitrilysin family protein [Fulvivirga kasyanovii]MTI27582.1 insulinase family protein [Fulvivirga kasyanovii]